TTISLIVSLLCLFAQCHYLNDIGKSIRSHLKSFMAEQNIRIMCGLYSGIVQELMKSQQNGVLDLLIADQRKNAGTGIMASYLGILRTGEYGKRIRMTAGHVMQEKGIMLQAVEIGGTFYLCWYQGFQDDRYVRAMAEELLAQDMPGTRLERLFPETPNRSISGKQKQTKKAHSVFIADMSFFLS
ncbi:MAG: hypothetical protein IJQ88_11530, partial [Clostridia bacterium]|nr:hypothetical protein [Clostridia bacterium]